MPTHVARSTLPKMKHLWWYPYDEATTSTLRAVAELYGAPTWGEKLRALGTIARSAGAALRNKI